MEMRWDILDMTKLGEVEEEEEEEDEVAMTGRSGEGEDEQFYI